MTRDIAASIRGRLYNKSKESGVEFQLLLARYACERFLYRLGASPVRERYILKGATLLSVWMKEPYRGTRDVDLLAVGGNDEDSVRRMMTAICKVPCPEDGLTIDVGTVRISSIRPGQPYDGQRVRFVCRLGQARIHTQVDIGFGDVITPGPREATVEPLIEGLPAPSLRVYPLVTSIAEKVDAMLRLGKSNSRMKDFHDVWALSEAFRFDGAELREAIDRCLERRGTAWTSHTPDALTAEFYSDPRQDELWKRYRREKKLLSPPPEAFPVIGERILKFVAPVLESILVRSPFEQYWEAGGPWQQGSGAHTEEEGSA